ncbi:eukaryotic translation initiation factor 2B alpha [Volvox carteri f. nagariensis]|uniref:Translation initiation factor eIF2B subunit alpha n=1 Tax=Volvox carteri f. nagariensis TaxID=3068 RepID=D8UHT5_VOLCA|nr:eukaryotic translation initiation factor 2B alpha [Volvox carteri f. nagariensis]EFJ40741.1 eukaryotic translation initiation factor 2B alpha [Volvox carteri f. nagariensis]|eukprot:XP_002958207.1 eukaryotic translation initiation factor 2B alpha [Volvox carteri f. nagariensis]
MQRRPSHQKLVVTEGFEANTQGTLNDIAVREFHDALSRDEEVAFAVAAIMALTAVIKRSRQVYLLLSPGVWGWFSAIGEGRHRVATTLMGVSKELADAAQALQRVNPTNISLKAGCELFLRYTTRTSALELQLHSLVGLQFSVIVTEGRPDGTGITLAKKLDAEKIPVTLVLDSCVAYIMDRVDMVLTGADAVVENGGIINKLGTYGIALAAQAASKPFYVAAESYKFARLYPLGQADLPEERKPLDVGPMLPPRTEVINPSRDYTPPQCISLLVTDLGVLTPAATTRATRTEASARTAPACFLRARVGAGAPHIVDDHTAPRNFSVQRAQHRAPPRALQRSATSARTEASMRNARRAQHRAVLFDAQIAARFNAHRTAQFNARFNAHRTAIQHAPNRDSTRTEARNSTRAIRCGIQRALQRAIQRALQRATSVCPTGFGNSGLEGMPYVLKTAPCDAQFSAQLNAPQRNPFNAQFNAQFNAPCNAQFKECPQFRVQFDTQFNAQFNDGRWAHRIAHFNTQFHAPKTAQFNAQFNVQFNAQFNVQFNA